MSQLSNQQAVQMADHAAGPREPSGPLAIDVAGLDKTFRIPSHRITSFKERAVHPFAGPDYRELNVLKEVSFQVHRGEFFGVVGRNGSGKSTLLKILASIYAADAGRIRMSGRLAPFIELGVGFNPDLAAQENIVLNGVMMGLTRKEALSRVDAVLDFAELRDFADLKLKNYSSGMSVRLAFAVMVQSDADILLIDEVLAVGDAAFQQKCADVFHEMRDAGKTIVLVTHDMTAVQNNCHRAMLLHDGEVAAIGDPEEVARSYLRLNFARGSENVPADPGAAVPDVHARVAEAWLQTESGERTENVEAGDTITMNVAIEARVDLANPVLGFHCYNADDVHVFGFNHRVDQDEESTLTIAKGEMLEVSCTLPFALTAGHYFLKCWVVRDRRPGDLALQALDLLDFVVFDVEPAPGILAVDPVIESRVRPSRPS